MSIFRTLESKLAGLFEGGFRRVFRSEVRPMEIAHKLVREMDEHRTSSVTRVYVPNEYLVWLSPEDRERYHQVEEELVDELCAYLLEHARREELTLASRPLVTFHTDEHLSLGEFGIQARMVREHDDDDSGELHQAEHGHTMIYTAPGRARGAAEERERGPEPRAFIVNDGKRLVIPSRGATIGRSRSCDIVLDDVGVSRHHARVIRSGAGWKIEDLGSTNGLQVNRSTVSAPRELHDGDRIKLGGTEVAFEVG